jgi:ATP adenylyltransferase
MLNIFPYNNGHILIAPYRHVPDTDRLSDACIAEIFSFVNEFKKAIRSTMKCHGFNLGANIGKTSGAGVADHIHFHLVPRWDGDTNFMPVISGTKVIPQSLEKVWELLWDRKQGVRSKRQGKDR